MCPLKGNCLHLSSPTEANAPPRVSIEIAFMISRIPPTHEQEATTVVCLLLPEGALIPIFRIIPAVRHKGAMSEPQSQKSPSISRQVEGIPCCAS